MDKSKPTYDYLIVGAGIFGAVFARIMTDQGKRCLVIEKKPHVAGHIYTRKEAGIDVHVFGAHIFHTSNDEVWDLVNRFAVFNRYTNSPIANYQGEIYNLPFNMNTFSKLWGIVTPEEAKAVIAKQRSEALPPEHIPENLEEQALSLVGRDVYEKLVKGYTEKQWGRDCRDLPAFIIRRLPVRFTYDNNYFDDKYQGIPTDGYTAMIENMLDGIDVRLNTDYFDARSELNAMADKVIYTGAVDEFFDYRLGTLNYRSLRFEHEHLEVENYQGNAVVNYTDRETPFTRIIEHKHFNFGTQPTTIISREYPEEWTLGMDAYYPVNDTPNQALYEEYKKLADNEEQVIFGGRLATYRYMNMDQVVESALELTKTFNETEAGRG